MGFYTHLGDELDGYNVKTNKLIGNFEGKFVGGSELYHWCFENNIEQIKVGYDPDSYIDESDLVFKLSQKNIEKAIKDEAMLENNSKTVLSRLLTQMILKDVEYVYFYGSF